MNGLPRSPADDFSGEKIQYDGHIQPSLPGTDVGDVGHPNAVGLRNLIDDAQAEGVYDVLRKRGEKISTATWNRRYREYMEKIRSGSLEEISSVLRDLCLRRADKELSYGERNMLETARALVVQELALAKSKTEAEVEEDLEAIFKT